MALRPWLLETFNLDDPSVLDTLVPSRSMRLVCRNETPNRILHAGDICVYVVDSPSELTPPYAAVAAMLIPPGLESDWTFSTERGHLQLFRPFYTNFARFFLIGNNTNSTTPQNYNRLQFRFQEREILEENLIPVVRALCPATLFSVPWPDVTFLPFNYLVNRRSVLEIRGEMLIEDVEFDNGLTVRNLRFKRTPLWYQTELRVVPPEATGGLERFVPDTGILIQANLTSMVTSLSLIASYLDSVRHPRALCLGVGGGALISFLSDRLNFNVVGVEVDENVLRVANEYFGLKDSGLVQLIVGDGIKFIEILARRRAQQDSEDFGDYKEWVDGYLIAVEDFLDAKFDVIMVDLDSRDDPVSDTGPPSGFVSEWIFLNAKSILNESGILVINVRPPDESFYHTLLTDLGEVFQELREINVSAATNTAVKNSILIASASPFRDTFLTRLRSVISGDFLGRIRRV